MNKTVEPNPREISLQLDRAKNSMQILTSVTHELLERLILVTAHAGEFTNPEVKETSNCLTPLGSELWSLCADIEDLTALIRNTIDELGI